MEDFNLDDFEIEDITPKKKKRKVDGGRKGKSGERELCKILSKRFGSEFTRTIGSGNRWSQVSNMPSHAKNTFTGDICCPEGFLFSIECKNGYEDKIDLGTIISNQNKTLDDFLKQAIKESKDCERKPLVCWKRKYKPWVSFVQLKNLNNNNFKSYLIYKDWICVDLEKLLSLPDNFFFEI